MGTKVDDANKTITFRCVRTSMIEGQPHERAYPDPIHEGGWIIDFKSLQDLLDFVKREGDVVLLADDYNFGSDLPVLEIYDDYRE